MAPLLPSLAPRWSDRSDPEGRYRGPGGRRVLAREMDCVRALLSRVRPASPERPAGPDPGRGHRALDAACGAGRAAAALLDAGYRPFGLERSADLLAAGPAYPGRSARGAAAALPYRDGVFEAVLLLRPPDDVDLDGLLREAARVLVPGGVIVLSIRRYRTARRPGGEAIRGRADDEVRAAIHRAGLEPVGRIGVFAAPPALLRLLGPLSGLAMAAERVVPERYRAVAFWALRKP